jgi:DNA-directed RNA polymerase subunit RPC12/RpoP
MSLYCPECGSKHVRQAHVHLSDTLHLLALQYPVRCRSCRKRWFVPLRNARHLPQAPDRHMRAGKIA